MAKGGGEVVAAPTPAPRYFYNLLENGKWRQAELPGQVYRYASDAEARTKFADEIASLAGNNEAVVPITGRDYGSFSEGEVYNIGGKDYVYKDGGFRLGKRYEVRGSENPVFQFITEQEMDQFVPGSVLEQDIGGQKRYFTFKNDAFEPFTFGQGEAGALEVGQGVKPIPGKQTLGRFSDTIVSNLSLGGGRVLGPPLGKVDESFVKQGRYPTVGQPLSPLRAFSMFRNFANRPGQPGAAANGTTSFSDSILGPQSGAPFAPNLNGNPDYGAINFGSSTDWMSQGYSAGGM